jgi:hypothetical protein
MDPEELCIRLRLLVQSMPSPEAAFYRPETNQWLGAAHALIKATGDLEDAQRLKEAVSHLKRPGSPAHLHAAAHIRSIVYRALAVAELYAPASSAGAFIAPGNAFEAFAALSKVFDSATTELLIIDQYMDEKMLTDFAVLASENISTRLLTDQQYRKPALVPAVQRWAQQYVGKRPLEARAAQPRQLHDRLIIVDDDVPWVLTQSFNAFAARAPASIIRIDDPELARLKKSAYQAIWDAALPL